MSGSLSARDVAVSRWCMAEELGTAVKTVSKELVETETKRKKNSKAKLQPLTRYLPLRNILPQSASVPVKAKYAVLHVAYEKRVRTESSKSFPGIRPSRQPVANTPFIAYKFQPPPDAGSEGDVQPWT